MSDHHHDHDHHHGAGHGHHHHGPAAPGARWRYAAAAVLVGVAALGATLVLVRAGGATVITRFGNPVRVIAEPGLAWKLPAPIERAHEVDLRLHTTSSGIHGVLTRDGLSVVVQAWVAWKVPADEAQVRRFLAAVQNNPTEAANQLRTFLGSSLETVTGRFELSQLLNTDGSKVRLADYEGALRQRLAEQAREHYGIEVVEVGIERLMLPETTVGATIGRMAAERDTVAEQKKAAGREQAGKIRSEAETEARIIKAQAAADASAVEAEARAKAATITGAAYQKDPQLYTFLRSLETLEGIVGTTSRLVLRTDAPPFRALVETPPTTGGPVAP